MQRSTADNSPSDSEWVSLGAALCKADISTMGAIHDCVASGGIYMLDAFNRPLHEKGRSESGERALRLIEAVANYATGGNPSEGDDRDPIERCAGSPDDPYQLFGWSKEHLPSFALGADVGGKKEPRAADTRKLLDSARVVIAALVKSKGYELGGRDTVAFVSKALASIKVEMSDDTIRGLMKSAEAAVQARSWKGP